QATPASYTPSLHDALPISPNGVIDPGETVTINFGLGNVGTANTTNLVATLLPIGGLASASGPQTYGALAANAAAATRAFSFTSTDRKSTRLNSSHVAISYA